MRITKVLESVGNIFVSMGSTLRILSVRRAPTLVMVKLGNTLPHTRGAYVFEWYSRFFIIYLATNSSPTITFSGSVDLDVIRKSLNSVYPQTVKGEKLKGYLSHARFLLDMFRSQLTLTEMKHWPKSATSQAGRDA